MKPCPTCGREIADPASVCDTCEAWAAAFQEAPPAEDAARAPDVPNRAAEPPAVVATSAPAQHASPSRRKLTLIAAAAVAAVALTGFAMSAGGGSNTDAPATAAAPAARVAATPTAASAAPAAAAAPVQSWSTQNQATWVDDPRRGAAFELLSENTIKTWFGSARPSLVVRCVARSIEAFVVTGSPLKIDPRVEGKTVSISMDGETPRTEPWIDSNGHTAVFAPVPAVFVQRLRTARTLHFGYSPHNSSDVVAQFHVAGIDALMAGSKHCAPAK